MFLIFYSLDQYCLYNWILDHVKHLSNECKDFFTLKARNVKVM